MDGGKKQGRFVQGISKQVGGGGRKQDVEVIVPDSLSGRFEVIKKAYMPDDGNGIVWVTNVGLKPLSDDQTVTDYYEVRIPRKPVLAALRKLNSELKDLDQVYIYFNRQVQALNSNDYVLDDNSIIALRLNLADPAVGIGGR